MTQSDRPSSTASRVRGPLLTLAIAIIFDSLARYGLVVPAPFPLLILAVIYTALTGGLAPAMVSATLTTVYAVHFYSERAGQLRYDVAGMLSLLSVAGAAWIAALLVGRVAPRVMALGGMTRKDADVIRRRLSLLEQTSAILASSLDYESMLARVARLLVPARADWCTIHLANEQGVFRFVAGAHRDPGRDIVVRALGEHDTGSVTFGEPGERADVLRIDQEALRRRAKDADHLKLYRTLGATAVVRVPILVRGSTGGVLTLVIAESARDITGDDVELAEELAGRASLAIENAMLHREASEADRRFQLLFRANPEPMWIFDVESLDFIAVNDASVRQYGYSRDELIAMTIIDLVPRQDGSSPIGPERGDHRSGVALARHQRKDGTIIDMELVSQELEYDGRRARLVVATDVSERTRALASLHQTEEQLRHAQRMDTVGRIGIGVAHDFNNVLTSIRGYGDILVRDLSANDPCRASVEHILQAADRGALLTRQLIAFGGRQPLQPRPVSINTLVREMEGLIRRLAGDDIEVDTRLAQGLGTVNIDPARLEQAVVSLILTAREAMPAGGTMTIETSERYMGGFPTGRLLPPGQFAVLAIGDTGSGLEAEPQSRPLDRRAGEGLGPRVVNSIVRQCGGMVRVTSEPGEGRTVKIYLPLINPRQSAEDFMAGKSPRGFESVLVAEDEESVRELVGRMLTDAGYDVLEAHHGRDALKIADHHDGPIHLLVTDVVMPGMSGGELAQALLELRPGMEVLYISGYTNSEVLNRGVRQAEDSFLNKPFNRDELLRKVRALLDKRSAWAPELSERGSAVSAGSRPGLHPEGRR